MHRGYIKLYRCIQENPIWADEPFSRGQAWLDMLLLANHRDSVIRKRGIRIEVVRGQVGWSERQLAERWQWSRGKVRRFLDELEMDQQIVQQNGPQNINVTSLITIVNYEKYQCVEPQNEPQIVPQTDHKRTANSTMDKNEKNEKKKDLKTLPPGVGKSGGESPAACSDEFESFWQVIPSRAKRCGKQEAWKSWQGKVHGQVEASVVIASVKAHMTSHDWTKEGGAYVPMITTWLNQRRWEVEVAALGVGKGDDVPAVPSSHDRRSRMREVLRGESYGD